MSNNAHIMTMMIYYIITKNKRRAIRTLRFNKP
ncbi:hypothetical protein LTSEUGA_4473, partial [Salmonella enterica subsp. enterica serovar Uganda str. R8-3404]